MKALVDSGYTGGIGITPGLASQLSLDLSTGTKTESGGAGGKTTDTDVNLPAGSSMMIGGGSTPSGQKTTAPTLPTTAAVSDFSDGTKADAIIGKAFLNQFSSKGDASGTKGDFYYLVAPSQKTTGLAKVQALINAAPPPLGPDGRPIGVLVRPIAPTPPLTGPPGSNLVPLDTGYNADVFASDPVTGFDVSGSFLIKSGSDRSLISQALANALGINASSLPLDPTEIDGSLLSLPTANVNFNNICESFRAICE